MAAAPPKPNVKSLSCPNCGGSVQVRGMGRTTNAVCIQCLSVIDLTSPTLQVIQQFKAAERYQPLIPLGTRGKMRGDPYEVIGFQVRELMADGVAYQWSEYILFNPYKGFRYLTEYNGHWNDMTTIKGVPTTKQASGRSAVSYLGSTYKHFQHYSASTIYVMGEFPWQVRVGESAVCDDYVSPPQMLSLEQTGNESNWSIGEYTPGETIWKNFGLKGSPPSPSGIFANQPSPVTGQVGAAWKRLLFWLTALFVLQLFWTMFDSDKQVFQQTYFYKPAAGTPEHSFVTPVFELGGRTSSVAVEITTDLNNNWAYFNLALISVDSGKAFDFSRQVSYYSGSDSDGSWTEGRKRDKVVLPEIAPGKYYMRVEPEMEATTTAAAASQPMRYQVTVRRDVPTWGYFWIAAVLLLIPALWTTIRRGSFETKRWAESDYGGSSTSSSDD